MHSKEAKVLPKSDYYTYQPSAIASKIYLYPIVVGHFYYEAGYLQRRNNYDSFLLMYISNGSCKLRSGGISAVASKGQFLLIDCYNPHEYGNDEAMDSPWIHFDGPLARSYYELITASHGNVLSPENPYPIVHTMNKIIDLFRKPSPIREAVISGYITQILTELLTIRSETGNSFSRSQIVENSLAYINEHFSEPLSLETIAQNANLSPYYFTRIFTAETGFTPHQYLIATRISYAKFLLQDTGDLPVKEIAFATGFNSESSFCTTFKKWEGNTPSEYREKTRTI